MTYEEIRSAMQKEKESHFYQRMVVKDFDHFSVCLSDKAGAIIVDPEVAPIVAKYKWCKDSGGYAIANIGGSNVRLHDYIMAMYNDDKPDGVFIDHINHDKLDNRKNNLRFVTQLESSRNMPRGRCNKSGAVGVVVTKQGKYRAYITYDHKQVNLGTYDRLEDAIAARSEGEQRFGYRTRPATVAEKCEIYHGGK